MREKNDKYQVSRQPTNQATNQPTKQATLRWERRWERKEKREEEEKRKKKMKRKERRKKNIRKICRFFTSLDDGDDAKEQWSLRTQVTIEPLRNNRPALNISLLELLRQLQFVFSGIVSTFMSFFIISTLSLVSGVLSVERGCCSVQQNFVKV